MGKREGESFVIGITGNIGTGKSTVAEMLADLGAETIDADKVAHKVMRRGSEAYDRIVDAFGDEILTPDGEIDRKDLGAIVFNDPQALARLETIVHPATLEAIDRRVAAASANVVAVEAIKLIESGLAERCDSVWVVTCRREQQIERLVRHRDVSREEARQRVEAQPPQAEKVDRADVVIDNSGPLLATREQVESAWGEVIDRAQGTRAAAWN